MVSLIGLQPKNETLCSKVCHGDYFFHEIKNLFCCRCYYAFVLGKVHSQWLKSQYAIFLPLTLTSKRWLLWLKVPVYYFETLAQMVGDFSKAFLFFSLWQRSRWFRDSFLFVSCYLKMSETTYPNISWNLNSHSLNIIKALFLPATEACNHLYRPSLQLLGGR